MSNEGPSWWRTRTCTGPDLLGDSKTWFVLFEFYQKCSQKYAFLRVSVCDGITSQDAFFKHDEIFTRYGYGFSNPYTQRLLQSLRNVVDQIDPGSVIVVMEKGQFATVEVAGENVKPTLRLTMKADLNPGEFVDRVTKYMTYVDALIESVTDDIASITKQKKELFRAVQKAAKAKREDDGLITQGMRMIMKEKRDYWRKQ